MRRGCLFHLYERSSLVTRRKEVRIRGGAFFGANVRREQLWRLSCWEGGRAWIPCPPASGAPSLPRLRVPARAGLFLCVKRPHRLRLCELDLLEATLGGDVYRDPRATDAPLLLSEGASHGGGPSQKLAAAPSEASSDSLARDWSVVAATIARRSGRRSSVLDAYSLNRRTVICGHGAA